MKEIDIKLTEEEFGMVQYCIEFISTNQRDFNEKWRKIIEINC